MEVFYSTLKLVLASAVEVLVRTYCNELVNTSLDGETSDRGNCGLLFVINVANF